MGLWHLKVKCCCFLYEVRAKDLLLQCVRVWMRGDITVLEDVFYCLDSSWQRALGILISFSLYTVKDVFGMCIGPCWGERLRGSDSFGSCLSLWHPHRCSPGPWAFLSLRSCPASQGFSLINTKFLWHKEVSSHFAESLKSEVPGPYITLCKYSQKTLCEFPLQKCVKSS